MAIGWWGLANERLPGKSIKYRTVLHRLKINDAATQTPVPFIKISLSKQNGVTPNTNFFPTLQQVWSVMPYISAYIYIYNGGKLNEKIY
jgi:hypothetical protein